MADFCAAQWPNLGPAGGLWTCTLDTGHDGDHEAHGPEGRLHSPSSIIPQGHEAVLPIGECPECDREITPECDDGECPWRGCWVTETVSEANRIP